ncbi:hypothetical protein K432DRAFT_385263 [Lepidopterella palustris CBS 459.81]|uniref:Heavy metal tolerance protein n=1 Tax=Lepidopterella palustris CBS 459.81 TaxID=1314670 RepID=A0A8E2E3L3_9PEZI|nr:hypothetical protein K432DRAFT_385263 [Lepidopterella palustris CBS 459.81]
MSRNASLLRALTAFHYLTPAAIASFAIGASAIAFCTLKSAKNPPRNKTRHSTAIWLTLAVTLSYTVEGFLYVLRALLQHGWWATQDAVLYVMGSVLVWACMFFMLLDTKAPVWTPYVGSWVLGFTLETVICTLSAIAISREDNFDNARLALETLRILILLVLSGNGLLLAYRGGDGPEQKDEESEPLLGSNLNGGLLSEADTQYGTVTSSPKSDESDNEEEEEPEDENKKLKEQQRKRLEEQGGWLGYLKGFLIFLPYIWPSNNRIMQLYIVVIGLCLVAERILNVVTPNQLGVIVDKLSDTAGSGYLPWKEVGLWIFYRWLSSRAALGALQNVLQLRISYWSYIKLTSVAFGHVMGLSMDFHDNKDSGELIKSVEQANALNSLIELVLFDTSPVIIDLFIALAYVTHLFDMYFAFVIIVVGVVYTIVTYKFTTWSAKMRRAYTEKSRNQTKILYESVSNWQTVSYFNRGDFEEDRLAKALSAEVKTGRQYYDATYLMFGTQELVMLLGRLAVSFLAAYRVSEGVKPIGNFVALSTYWSNLSYPLYMLAYSYRQLTSNLIDAERLLQLLNTKSKVTDREGASAIKIDGGRVEFTDVSFAYDERKPTIKGINFVAEPGETVALVGETGSGKSTTLKLLFRFYDVRGGSIKIDGQDIRDVLVSSLRDALGVVPQDPSLFNTSILENVRYARLDATDEEVHEACKAASIHDKILTFPDGYKTKVGERGVKLSGGELQRVSIARVFLKNPQIVLLDEATSAIDSSTEAQIQDAFKKLSAGRTTFVIAHRLSTIMDADRILLIDNGEIVERGTHQELLDLNGKYVNLWNKQSAKKKDSEDSSVTAEVDAEELLIPDLPPNSYSCSGAHSTGTTNSINLIDQVDGQSDSKQMPGSNPARSKSMRKRFHDLMTRRRKDDEDDEDNEDDEEGDGDITGEETVNNSPLTVISPRPTFSANGSEETPTPKTRRRSSVSSKRDFNSTGTQVKHSNTTTPQRTSTIESARRSSLGTIALSTSPPAHGDEQRRTSSQSPQTPDQILESKGKGKQREDSEVADGQPSAYHTPYTSPGNGESDAL